MKSCNLWWNQNHSIKSIKMMNDKLIKVCGMREAENIREVEQLKVDMIGFIFYPKSPVASTNFLPTCRSKQSVSVSLSTKTKG